MRDETFVRRIEAVFDYWKDKLPIMTCEECGELIQAISKVERKLSKDTAIDKDIDNVKTEIADVVISMAALCVYYDISFADVDKAIKTKLSINY